MRRNRPSEAPGLRAKLARGSAGFGAGPNKRDFSGFGGGRNLKNSQVYRHLHRLPQVSGIHDTSGYQEFRVIRSVK